MKISRLGEEKEMPKLIFGLLSGTVLFLAVPAMADHGDHAGARMNLGQPDYERTVSGSEPATLVHTKAPAKHTICQILRDTDMAIIHYDDNKMILGPGHCVLVEASYITVQSSEGVRASVFGWHHDPGHQHK
jgi:hypothetical protein